MKKLSVIAISFALLMLSSPSAFPQAQQATNGPPPVAPALVREGDFAIRLVSNLEIGTAANETEAEAILASAGIAPKNGWISDYPVTPDILGELQNAVAAAADSNRLLMGKDEALQALDTVSANLGLFVVAHESGGYTEIPLTVSSQYAQPTVINNYYYREGPPVVTYYTPPPDYLYLYAWVPYPFWCSRFFFSGFFILHDFHKVVRVRNRTVVVSNHFFHSRHHRFFKVDPIKRRGGRSMRAVAGRTEQKLLFVPEARRGARSILQRSHDRMRPWTELGKRNYVVGKSPIGSARHASTETARQIRPFNDLMRVRTKSFPGREVQRARRGSETAFEAPRLGERSSSSLPSMGGRNFSGGLRGSSKDFSAKIFKKLPGGGSALKRVPRVPF